VRHDLTRRPLAGNRRALSRAPTRRRGAGQGRRVFRRIAIGSFPAT
jgi:hypothetical protein